MKRKRAIYLSGLAILAAFLIGFGLFRVVRVYQHYRTDMLSYESRHLDSIVNSGARGVDWIVEGYAAQIEQYKYRPEFIRAEEQYTSTGSTYYVEKLMERFDLMRPTMSCIVAVYDVDGSFLASSESGFPVAAGTDEAMSDTLLLRTDPDGTCWFIFSTESSVGFRYEIAATVQSVFSGIAEVTSVGQHGYLFMLDREGRFVAYSGDGNSNTCSVEELYEIYPAMDRNAVRQLSEERGQHRGTYHVYRYPWSAFSGGSNETLVVTCPVQMSEDLVMGAAMSFQEFNSFLSDTLQEITWVILMEIAGALILFFMAAWVMVQNRRDRLELEAVRERADLMEEINRQQQSLAHTERLQQLGVMTSGIVHEFNNMLTPIMSQSMLLLEQMEGQEETQEFESALDIFEASEKARDMLRRMSSMSKKEVDMGFHPLEIGELLKKTMNLSSMAKDPHILQELILPKEPVFVSGNDQLLTQAILNLCINACQAMAGDGSGTLTVEATTEAGSGKQYVTIQIMDTGPGISAEKLSSIFDPFYTTKGERGTGLGLAICQKIIETHKGTIRAANRESGGAVFTVRIPTCDLPEDE